MFLPGDLVFYSKSVNSEFCEAVEKVVRNNEYFHVAIVVENGYIVEATEEGGVQKIEFFENNRFENFHEANCIEIIRPEIEESKRIKAAKWAQSIIGAEYNDIFSPECRNSHDKEAYYCSQIVTEAYLGSGLKWPKHSLNFLNENGELIEFWKSYFKKKGRNIPQGQDGSHPGQIRRVNSKVNAYLMKILIEILVLSLTSMSMYRIEKMFIIIFQFIMKIIPNAINLKSLKESTKLLDAPFWVNGQSVQFQSSNYFDVIEPRSGLVLAKNWCYANNEQVDSVVEIARKGQEKWAKSSWMERSDVLKKTAEILKSKCDEISYWECLDNGKPIYEAVADVMSCVDTFSFYSGVAQNLLGRHIPLDNNRYAYTKRVPIGVVASIGAWNYPIQTCSWKTAPALACGNSVIYKPSPLCPISALILGAILKEAGLPDGVYNVIQGDSLTATRLIENEFVTKVSFTGSIPTGKKIMKACAERNIKPVTLELGGKSSLIVYDDANIDSAVSCAMMANFYSQGQVCSNASKVLVHRTIIDEFTEKLVKRTNKMIVGDPLKETTKVGSHISKDHMEKVEKYITDAVSEGAKLLYGGKRISVPGLENGYYLSPCILSNVNPSMKVFNEEIFGSVLLIIPFENEEEAIDMANATKMGLAAGIVTTNLERTYRVVNQLKAGNVYVNTYNDVSPFVPFGGFGESGFGRENGTEVLEHYTQIKSVFVNTGKCENPF